MGSERKFDGFVDCIRKTVRTERLAGLYKGLGPSLFSIAPYLGIGFTMYDELKLKLAADDSLEPTLAARLLAGSGSGVIAQSITYPIDPIRRRMQMDGQLGQ